MELNGFLEYGECFKYGNRDYPMVCHQRQCGIQVVLIAHPCAIAWWHS